MSEPSTTTAPALDFSDFDPEVRVQDDLYRHVNGHWLAEAEIPADKPLTGAFMDLRDQAEIAVRDIITTLDGGEPGSDEAKIADLYASFMDEDAVEAAGASPLLPLLRRDRRGRRHRAAGRAARPVHPAGDQRPGRGGDRVRPG